MKVYPIAHGLDTVLEARAAKKRAYHAAWNRRDRERRWLAQLAPKNRSWNQCDLAWAAGLFEGEGCFSSSVSRNSRSFTLRINMIDQDVIEKFARIMDFGSVVTVAPKQPHHLPQWAWQAYGFEKFQAVAVAFWPWLGVRRRQRIREILAQAKTWFEGTDARGYPRRYRRFKRAPSCV